MRSKSDQRDGWGRRGMKLNQDLQQKRIWLREQRMNLQLGLSLAGHAMLFVSPGAVNRHVSRCERKHASPRSVFMSLRDLPNEGRVLVGLAFGALELITTGGITE